MKIWRFRIIDKTDSYAADAVSDDYGTTRQNALNRELIELMYDDHEAIVSELMEDEVGGVVEKGDHIFQLEMVDVSED